VTCGLAQLPSTKNSCDEARDKGFCKSHWAMKVVRPTKGLTVMAATKEAVPVSTMGKI
jgi:hypothetical protein